MQHIKNYHYDNDDMIDNEIYINAASRGVAQQL